MSNPALRSRGNVTAAAKALYEDPASQGKFRELFESAASGRFELPQIWDHSRRLRVLEDRLDAIEIALKDKG